MITELLLELGKGLGRFLLNPAIYILGLIAYFMGVVRVKRERHDFHVRVQDAVTELKSLLFPSVICGLLVSLVVLGTGMIMPFGLLLFLLLYTLLFSSFLQVRWLSPAYIVGFIFFIALLLPEINIISEGNWVNVLFQEFTNVSLEALAILMATLLAVESLLIIWNGHRNTSPRLQFSKRGKRIGLHEAKKLWMLPVFLLVPGAGFSSALTWWPVFELGETSYSIIVVPFVFGFFQQVKGMPPEESIKMTGKQVFGLSLIVGVVALLSLWVPMLSIVSVGLAILGRESITLKQRLTDEATLPFFSNRGHGLVILGIIPKSPAEKMEVKVGEIVAKVNGEKVKTEKEFYNALQKNRAFCKLEVLDFNGEIRFAQSALYDGEHHELGLLFVHEDANHQIIAM